MNNEQLFDEFENAIEAKYGHMAEDMLSFFDEFTMFFGKKKLDINKFTKKQIDILIDEYLNFEGLTDAECSMLFQTLVDFSDFCISKNIGYQFLKTFLEKEKDILYSWWSEEEPLFPEDDDFPDITSEDIMNNFDSFYNIMNIQSKHKKPDIPRIFKYLEELYELSTTMYEKTKKLREQFPDITESKLTEKIIQSIDKKIVPPDEFEELEQSALLLPREQAKKFFTIAYKMEKSEKLKPGTIEKEKTIEDVFATLKDLIDDLRKMKGKKKS